MKIEKRFISFFLLVFLVLLFSYPIIAISDPSTSTPVIGHLHARDKIVTITSGSDGPVFSVKSSNGDKLADLLSIYELIARFPDLENVVKRGIAGNDASLGPEYMRKYRRNPKLLSKPWDL